MSTQTGIYRRVPSWSVQHGESTRRREGYAAKASRRGVQAWCDIFAQWTARTAVATTDTRTADPGTGVQAATGPIVAPVLSGSSASSPVPDRASRAPATMIATRRMKRLLLWGVLAIAIVGAYAILGADRGMIGFGAFEGY